LVIGFFVGVLVRAGVVGTGGPAVVTVGLGAVADAKRAT